MEQPLKVMVIDDSRTIRRTAQMLLGEAGCEVITASDGFDALATLKADTRTSPIPAIMVTAKGRPEDMAMARSLGAVEYITKPWADGDVELRVDWALAADREQKKR